MRTLEVIHLRLSGDHPEGLVGVVRSAVAGPHEFTDIRIYRHARVENDLLIQLHREGPNQSDKPSELGFQLASLLRMHGLVEHSVWVRADD